LLAVAPQRSDVHLFGLLTQFIFVVENSTDDEIVAADDDQDGKDEHEGEAGENVALVANVGGYSIKGASFFNKIGR
jgi:hypothetical protein